MTLFRTPLSRSLKIDWFPLCHAMERGLGGEDFQQAAGVSPAS